MNQGGNDGSFCWLCCVSAAGCGLAATVFQVAAGSCEDQNTSNQRRQNYQENKCWYELWYFCLPGLCFISCTPPVSVFVFQESHFLETVMLIKIVVIPLFGFGFAGFIVVLVFLTVAILILFFCKQQVKRSMGRQGRRCTPVLTMPMAPPQYEVPGHQPPPYHIAISSPPFSCGLHSGHGLQCPALQPYVLPPGYVGDREQNTECEDNVSVTSATSAGTLSNPPPYSPPSSAYRSYLCGNYLRSHQSGHS